MTINPRSLKVSFSNFIPDWDEQKGIGPFFRPSYGNAEGPDFYSVEHLDGKPPACIGGYNHFVRYNYFDVTNDNILRNRSKEQEIAKGPFGTICAETTFRYEKEYAPHAIAFEVSANHFHDNSEPPRVVATLPKHTRQTLHKFTVMSVVRVFRSAKGYTVAIGYYSPEGRLIVPVSSELMKNGERVSPDTMTYGDEEHDRIAFGFPTQIHVAKYLKNPKPFWTRTALLNTTNIVNFHYDRNKWIRQDTFTGTSSPKTRFLTYLITAQDMMLAPIDQKMPFRMPGQS